MLARSLLNEYDKGSNPLGIVTWSVLGKQNEQVKKVYCRHFGHATVKQLQISDIVRSNIYLQSVPLDLFK